MGSRIRSYQIVKLKDISDKKKVQSLDKFVRNKKVLDKLRTKAQGESGEMYELSKDMPKVHRYPMPRMETFIALSGHHPLSGQVYFVSIPFLRRMILVIFQLFLLSFRSCYLRQIQSSRKINTRVEA